MGYGLLLVPSGLFQNIDFPTFGPSDITKLVAKIIASFINVGTQSPNGRSCSCYSWQFGPYFNSSVGESKFGIQSSGGV